MKIRTILAAALLAVLATGSQAATLNFLGDVDPAPNGPSSTYVPGTVRGTLTCTACLGLDSTQAGNVGNPPALPNAADANGFIGTNYSDLFSLSNSGIATETAFINAVTGGLFSGLVQVAGGGGALTFTSSALYIYLKIGSDPNVTVIKNTGNSLQTFSWLNSGQGAGLSHYIEVGSVCQIGDNDCDGDIDQPPPPPPTVPVPAAGFLLLGALGGLVGLRRRRK